MSLKTVDAVLEKERIAAERLAEARTAAEENYVRSIKDAENSAAEIIAEASERAAEVIAAARHDADMEFKSAEETGRRRYDELTRTADGLNRKSAEIIADILF